MAELSSLPNKLFKAELGLYQVTILNSFACSFDEVFRETYTSISRCINLPRVTSECLHDALARGSQVTLRETEAIGWISSLEGLPMSLNETKFHLIK
ncbi:MAG: hypothetical protein AUG51_24025 [Acidobacteria bacterium 13_1_20CM_3_53_8]|nr:MAG: hypothetical protein AUG51_24025 [Acidobacteria bacterium 13_1_20CM_3_53_8]